MKSLSEKMSRRRMMSLALAAGAAMGAMSGKAKADFYQWQGGIFGADWNTATDWLDITNGTHGVPPGGANALVGQGIADFSADYSSSALAALTVQWNSGSNSNIPEVEQANGYMNALTETIGGSTYGNYDQFGGTNNVAVNMYIESGASAGYSAEYSLQVNPVNPGLGATLNAGNEYIGNSGAGSFTQAAGTTNDIGANDAAGTGTLFLGGSQGSSGLYTMNGGTLTISGPNYAGGAGTLFLGENQGSSGTFTMNGGTLTISGPVSNPNVGTTIVGDGGVGAFNQNGGSASMIGNLVLGTAEGSAGTYSLVTGGALNVTEIEIVGEDGAGHFTQGPGTTNLTTSLRLGYDGGSSGTYTMTGGSLIEGTANGSGWEEIGISGSGAFNQSGGTNTINAADGSFGWMNIADENGEGVFSLSGTGVVNVEGGVTVGGGARQFVDDSYDGGIGVLNIRGGAMNAGGLLEIYSEPGNQVNLSGGSLTVGVLNTKGNPADFLGNETTTGWTGGTLTLTNQPLDFTDGTDPIYNGLSFGNSLTLHNGQTLNVSNPSDWEYLYGASSSITQAGGSNNTPALFMGNNAGTASADVYRLSGGSLNVSGGEYIGYTGLYGNTTGNAVFTQTAGNNTAGTVYIGYNPGTGASGTYNLGQVGTLAASEEDIGYAGTGVLNQTGGINAISNGGNLNLGTTVGGNGTYNLSGGSVTVNGNVYVGGSASGAGGAGVLDIFGTSKMTVTGGMTIYSGSGNHVDFGGESLTVGSISGSSFVWASGSGSLTLTNQDASLGFVNSSTLELNSGPGVAFQANQILSLPNNSFTIASGSALTLKGSMNVGGNFTIGQTAGLGFLRSGATLQVGGNFVNNGGNYTVTGNGVALDSPTTIGGALLNNATGVLFISNTNVTVGSGNGTQALSNLGTIYIHNSTINMLGPADLPGTIISDPSIMNFEGGLTIDSTGSIQAGTGDIIAVSGGDFVDNSTIAPSFSGATLHMDGTGTQKIVLGTSQAAGMTVGTLDVGASTLNIVDGSGNPATLVTNDLVFDGMTAPTINGTIVDSGLANLTGPQAISAATANPSGADLFWTSTSGGFTFSNGATYTNSGVFNASNDQSFSGTGTFDNEGTFRKQQSVGTSVVSIPFINNGIVDAHSGTLSFQGGVTGTGNYLVASGATMEVRNSNLSGGDVDNEGTLLVTNTPGNGIPGIATVGNVTGAGTTTIVGSGSTLSALSGSQTNLNITDGQLALQTGDFTATNVTLTNATLIGNAGVATGSPTGPAVTATGTFSTGNLTLKSGAILNIGGIGTASGNNIAGDANTEVNIQSGGSLTNTGTGLFFSIPVNVDGTIATQANGGPIVILAGGTHGGTFNVASNSSITGSGDFTVSAVVNDNSTFQLGEFASSPTTFDGTLNVAAGATLSLGTATTISSLATVNFSDGASLSALVSPNVTFNNNQVMNVGTANLSGSITFRNAGLSFNTLTYGTDSGPSQLAIETGGTVNIGTLSANGNIVSSGLGDGHPTTLNVGTFNLTGSDVSADINVTTAMNWTGGGLDGGDGTQCTVTIEPGATLDISGTGGSLTRGAVLNNEGNLSTAGPLTIGGADGSGLGNKLSVLLNSNAVINGILGVGNNGSLTSGSGTGIVNVSGSLLVTRSIILGSTVGGDGALNVFTGGLANAAGLQYNDATINGGELDIPSSAVQPGDDPEIDGSIVGGYMRNGAFNVNGGIVNSPKIKLGVSSGFTGTYTQTDGSVTTGIMGIGNDASISSGSGIGHASISGGTLAAGQILIGSTAGGAGDLTISGSAIVTAGSMTNLGTLTMTGGMATIGGISGTGSTTINGGSLQLSPHSGVSTQGALVLSGTGVLDITDNQVVVNYGVGNSSPAGAIGNAIKSAYSGATFSGAGITSSTVASVNAAHTNSHLFAVAYADASDAAVAGDHFAAGTVVIEPALVGDANLDGKVTFADFLLLASHFNAPSTSWDQGNFNYGAKTDFGDFLLLAANFNNSTSLDNAQFDAMNNFAEGFGDSLVANGDGSGFTIVPEPASLGMVGFAAVGLLGRRRRRNRG